MGKFILTNEDHIVLSGWVSSMINRYNNLRNTRTPYSILNDKATYCLHTVSTTNDTMQIVGCVGIIKEYPTLSRIMHLCVKEEYRELGIGKTLVNNAMSISKTKNVYMRINKNNIACITMARKIGFVTITQERKTIIMGRRACIVQ